MNDIGKQKLSEAIKIATDTIGDPKFWDTDQMRLALTVILLTNELERRGSTAASHIGTSEDMANHGESDQ